MKISVEFYDRKVTIESANDDMTCTDFVDQMVKPLMLGMEYHNDNVEYALGETYIDPTQQTFGN